MVLWSKGGGVCKLAKRKCGRAKGRSAGLSKESAGKASNLMRRPVRRGNRDATTSACVGWEYPQYRKSAEFPQDGVRRCRGREAHLKRLDHYQNNDPDHQDRRYLVDTTIKFL